MVLSGLIAPAGPSAQILGYWFAGEIEVVSCPRWLAELAGVLGREKFARYGIDAPRALAVLAGASLARPDPGHVPARCADPDDDYLLALGLEADADALVSGDRHLLEVEPPPPVLSPRAFLDRLAGDTEP